MTEAELVSAFATFGQSFLAGVQATFTIVSAYLVALYFFLGRAPLAMRITAFAFLTATLLLLALFTVGAAVYGDGIVVGLIETEGIRALSTLGRRVVSLANHPLAYALVFASAVLGALAYGALGYLTFVYRWPASIQDRSP